MWPTEMSPVESREAERRVKTLLFSSMVGLLVGLLMATVIEAEHPTPSQVPSEPLLKDQSYVPNEPIDRKKIRKEGKHAQYSPR